MIDLMFNIIRLNEGHAGVHHLKDPDFYNTEFFSFFKEYFDKFFEPSSLYYSSNKDKKSAIKEKGLIRIDIEKDSFHKAFNVSFHFTKYRLNYLTVTGKFYEDGYYQVKMDFNLGRRTNSICHSLINKVIPFEISRFIDDDKRISKFSILFDAFKDYSDKEKDSGCYLVLRNQCFTIKEKLQLDCGTLHCHYNYNRDLSFKYINIHGFISSQSFRSKSFVFNVETHYSNLETYSPLYIHQRTYYNDSYFTDITPTIIEYCSNSSLSLVDLTMNDVSIIEMMDL